MSCPRHKDISAYRDHMLPAVENERFAQHLATCALCRAHLDALATLQGQLRELPSPPLGFDLAAQFDDRWRSGALRASPTRHRRPGWSWGWAGVVGALSMASGVWLGGLLIGGAALAPSAGAARVFDPVPPGGLCAAPELCRIKKGTP